MRRLFPLIGVGGVSNTSSSAVSVVTDNGAGELFRIHQWEPGVGFGSAYAHPSGNTSTIGATARWRSFFDNSNSAWLWGGQGASSGSLKVYSWSPAGGIGSVLGSDTSYGGGASFSASDNAIAAGDRTANSDFRAWPWSNATGLGTQYSDPNNITGFSGTTNGTAFSPNGGAVACAISGGSFALIALGWSSGSGFSTRFTDPSGFSSAITGWDTDFSPTGSVVAVGTINSSARVSVWPWSDSTGFGTKYANPATAGTGAGHNVRFNAAGNVVCAATSATPFIHAWGWSDATGFGTKYANPSTVPTGSAYALSIDRSDTTVAVANISSSPYLNAYEWSNATGFGTRYSDPSPALSGSAYSVSFN
jgi:hypothetical protein